MLHMYLGVFAFCEHFCSSEWHVNSTPGMSYGLTSQLTIF